MSGKIYPNDMCPCGSGMKYKNCCGSSKKKTAIARSKDQLEDHVLKMLDQDLVFLSNMLQIILGPWGYNYCQKNADYLEKAYQDHGFYTLTKEDELKLFNLDDPDQSFRKLRSYGGGTIENVVDVLSLSKEGFICKEGRQVELFHAYLLENLKRRFTNYLYVPDNSLINEHTILGPFAHRGYDFLLAITLYLELQLGVHIYLEEHEQRADYSCFKNQAKELFWLPDIELPTGMVEFLLDYFGAITSGIYKYSLNDDIELYNSIGLYRQEIYKEFKKMLLPDTYPELMSCNYARYLILIVSATCFNYPGMYAAAMFSFPQCDYTKYITGIEYAVELFEERKDIKRINPKEVVHNSDKITDDIKELLSSHEGIEKTMREHYHDTVFFLLDELNGLFNHTRPSDLVYIDDAGINDDEFTFIGEKRCINPARKTTSVTAVRKLKMEIFDFLNGKFFYLRMGPNPGEDKNYSFRGKYPILPWVSSGMEDTNHLDCDDNEITFEDIYSRNIIRRQKFLRMEYRLTEIPVNCIQEFLNPDVFYNWKKKHDLLKEVQEKNALLEKNNEQLRKHIHLNQELIRNLSHSSSNYLNSKNLLNEGKILQHAEKDDPTLDALHKSGASLILQSEQEEYLLRQLNSLVWRCSEDSNYLTTIIRQGLAKEANEPITAPLCFALKTVMSRVLFRESDLRSKFIRKKLV